MRRFVIVLITGLVSVRSASATPVDPVAKYREAAKLAADDDNEKALALVDEGLAVAPKSLQLLELKANLLVKMRDYDGALSAFQSYIDAGATGANKRAAQKIVASLQPVKTSFLEVSVTNGEDANVYLDTKSQGAWCTTATCKRGMLPGTYKIIVERTGFDRWTKSVTVEAGKLASVSVTLAEKPSQVTFKPSQPGAVIEVDGNAVSADAPVTLPAGDHAVVAKLPHFATVTQKLALHEGKAATVEVALVPIVPFTANAAGAEVSVDGAKVAPEQGGIAIAAGAHVVAVTAPGFHGATVDVPVERPADYKLDVTLAEIGAMVDVSNAPKGARIVVDGKTIATMPTTGPVEVPPGPHAFEVKVDGYLPYRSQSAFEANRAVHVKLGSLKPQSRTRTYLSLGGTGVGLVVGALASWKAVSNRNAFDARAKLPGVTNEDPELKSLSSDGKTLSLAADVGFGVALIGAALTTYYFTHEGRGESSGSLTVGVGLGTAMLSGKF